MAIQAVKSIIDIIVVSLFIFPIEFVFLPGINSKMILAVCGVIALLTHHTQLVRKEYIILFILAFLVSFCGAVSVLYNDTTDFTYTSYVVSFIVWISAAFGVVSIIRGNDGSVTIRRMCYYLIAVAVLQCALAIMLDLLPAFRNAVNSVVVGFGSMYSAGTGLSKAGRLYGIGAALDVAGTRFAPILAILFIFILKSYEKKEKVILYLLTILWAFVFVVGSMISRTTIIGFIVGLVVLLGLRDNQKMAFCRYLLFAGLIFFGIASILYLKSGFFHDNVRFAFEGFFNFFERGEWTTNSTEELQAMYKLPDTIKTLIIGDGYFNEPYYTDPYYSGAAHRWGIFYMGTDVGYLRFIYYFGILGLVAFMAYFIYAAVLCCTRFPVYKWVFIILLLCNFIIWFKVATDIFCLFALFLCVPLKEESREVIAVA
ncbi:MAG: hypothetical protein ACI3ZP_01380 [Candidatus Cryptobacteroides sp.]